jgi:hypothetical protein
MANPDRLNQLILRTILLEGGSGDKVLKKIKAFNAGKKTAEDKQEIANFLKKEVSATAKELISEDQISTFVDELSDQA